MDDDSIVSALAQLDQLNDDHWTKEGEPRLDIVGDILERKVTREEVKTAAPKFTRLNPDLGGEGEEPANSESAQSGSAENDEPENSEPELSQDVSGLEVIAHYPPMQERHFIDHIRAMPTEQLPEIEKILALQLEEIARREAEIAETKRLIKANMAVTKSAIRVLIPDMTNQEAIQHYIRSQTAARAAKSAKLQEILGGLKPSDLAKLDPRAAIDRAFARRTARGGQRPVR